MLIVKPLTKGTVVALKFKNGTDLVARLAADYARTNDVVSVTKPIETQMQMQQGGVGLAFIPFSLVAQDDQVFDFPKEALLVEPFLARDEITASYTQQTTSLAVPPKSSLQL